MDVRVGPQRMLSGKELARLVILSLSFSLSPSQTWPYQGWSQVSSLSFADEGTPWILPRLDPGNHTFIKQARMPAKYLNGSISFIPGPFVGYQRPGDLLIRVLSWSSFSERGAGELSAGNTRIRSRANKNSNRKGGRIQGGVEAEANLEGPLS